MKMFIQDFSKIWTPSDSLLERKIIFLQINLTELLRAKAEKPAERSISNWSGRQDSNLRPTVPKTVALPGCATPRRNCLYIIKNDLKRPKG